MLSEAYPPKSPFRQLPLRPCLFVCLLDLSSSIECVPLFSVHLHTLALKCEWPRQFVPSAYWDRAEWVFEFNQPCVQIANGLSKSSRQGWRQLGSRKRTIFLISETEDRKREVGSGQVRKEKKQLYSGKYKTSCSEGRGVRRVPLSLTTAGDCIFCILYNTLTLNVPDI